METKNYKRHCKIEQGLRQTREVRQRGVKKCKNILGTKDPCRSPRALVRTLWPIVTLTRPRPSSLHSLRDVD